MRGKRYSAFVAHRVVGHDILVKTSDDQLISLQLGPRTEERETFTRLLGHLLEGRHEGVRLC